MPPELNPAHEEDLTAEELAQLEGVTPTPGLEIDDSTGLPEPAAVEAPAAAAPAAAAPAAAPGATPAAAEPAPAAADATKTAEEAAAASFAEFTAKHKDRSPEELLRLAFDKEQARRTARYEAKEARETITQVRTRMQNAVEATRTRQAADRAKFDETLATDPDAAARMAFEGRQAEELARVESEAWTGYVDEQTRLAANIIPAFEQTAPQLLSFGVERMGYDEGQVRAVHDARDLTTLYMAMQFDKLVQAGIVAFDGTVGTLPTPVVPVATQPARTPPLTLSSAPGGAGVGQSKSLRAQADDVLAMSDNDFEKLDPAALESLLQGLGGVGR